jgi:ATP-binding cassette, subfamily B (MDR/TAP), member 1
MRAGEVVEEGTHQSLIEKGGQYARLVKAQDLSVEESEPEKGDSEAEEGLGITKSLTRNESVKQTGFVEEDESEVPNEWKKVGLLRCIYFLIKEMYPQMWMSYIVLGVTSLVGGKNSCSMALFAKY